MESGVLRANEVGEFYTPERCYILEVANDAADTDASIARARVVAGTVTQLHRLNGTDERYLVTEGTGKVEIGGADAVEIGQGSVVRIPSGTSQRVINDGDRDLVFWCVCTPRFVVEVYESLE